MKFFLLLKKSMRFLLRIFFQHCIALPFAAAFCALKFHDKNTTNVIVCDHIGDMLFTLGYISEYKQKYEIETLYIFCTERFNTLLGYYQNLSCKYVSISKKMVHTLLFAYNCKLGQSVLKYFRNVKFVEPTNIFKMEFDRIKHFPNITLKECIKYGAFELNEDSMLAVPEIAGNEKLSCKKDSIIICPEAQVIDGEETEILVSRLGSCFREKGYQVYINTTLNKSLNTNNDFDYVNWTLDEFFVNAHQCAAVIGTRSGILDLAAFANTTVIALYPSDYDTDLMRFFDLQSTNPSNKSLYQYRLSANVEQDLKTIIGLFNESNKKAVI